MAPRGILGQLVDLAKAVTAAATSAPPAAGGTASARGAAARTAGSRRGRTTAGARRSASPPSSAPSASSASSASSSVPSSSAGLDTVHPTYAPERDGEPDPGEVVWAYVPYEDDPTRGKDRPVLVLAVEPAQRGREVVGLMLTSKDHSGPTSRDAADELRHGRHWMDVGTGGWDAQRRPSEVRLDRLLRLPASAVRREGAALDRRVFTDVAEAASRLHDWT